MISPIKKVSLQCSTGLNILYWFELVSKQQLFINILTHTALFILNLLFLPGRTIYLERMIVATFAMLNKIRLYAYSLICTLTYTLMMQFNEIF
jgi:hypothetical protein